VLADLAPRMNQIAVSNPRLAQVRERLRGDDAVTALLGALDGTRTLWSVLQNARTPRAMAAAWLLDALRAVDYHAPDQPIAEPDQAPELEIVLTEVAPAAAAQTPRRAAAPVSAAAGMNEVLVLEVSQKYVALGELDYYALLGIDRDAAPAAVRRAYLDAAKRYHPDALARAGLDRETREKAGRVFTAIGKAHAVLSDPKRRRSYDASLDSDETDLDAERLAAAETNYRKGEILMRQGNFRGALEFLRPAVELWPEERTYRARSAGRCSRPRRRIRCARASTRARARARAAQRRVSRTTSRCAQGARRGRARGEPREQGAQSDRAEAGRCAAYGPALQRVLEVGSPSSISPAPSRKYTSRARRPSAPRRCRSPTRTCTAGACARARCRDRSIAGLRRRQRAPLDHRAGGQRVERLHRGLLQRLGLLLVVESLAIFSIE
jgi:curved DNA-binding protein CbpA